MECRTLPSKCNLGHVGVLYILIQAGDCQKLAAEQPLGRAGEAVQYVKAKGGGTAPPPPTSLLQLDRAGRRVGSILYGLRSLCHCNHNWGAGSQL